MKLEGHAVYLSPYCRFIASLSRSLCGDIEGLWPVLNVGLSNSSRLTTPCLITPWRGQTAEYEYVAVLRSQLLSNR